MHHGGIFVSSKWKNLRKKRKPGPNETTSNTQNFCSGSQSQKKGHVFIHELLGWSIELLSLDESKEIPDPQSIMLGSKSLPKLRKPHDPSNYPPKWRVCADKKPDSLRDGACAVRTRGSVVQTGDACGKIQNLHSEFDTFYPARAKSPWFKSQARSRNVGSHHRSRWRLPLVLLKLGSPSRAVGSMYQRGNSPHLALRLNRAGGGSVTRMRYGHA